MSASLWRLFLPAFFLAVLILLIGTASKGPVQTQSQQEEPNTAVSEARNASSEEEAVRAHLAEYGPLFGVEEQSRELRAEESEQAEGERTGRSVVRFQQVYEEVPVLGSSTRSWTPRGGFW